MEERKVKIRSFLSRFLRKYELKDDDKIFELGFVNSLFAIQLVMFLEKEFGIRIENSDMDIGNFSSISSINDFIEKREQHNKLGI